MFEREIKEYCRRACRELQCGRAQREKFRAFHFCRRAGLFGAAPLTRPLRRWRRPWAAGGWRRNLWPCCRRAWPKLAAGPQPEERGFDRAAGALDRGAGRAGDLVLLRERRVYGKNNDCILWRKYPFEALPTAAPIEE